MIFKFREGSHLSGDAAVVGERLERIANKNAGNITPTAVIEDARAKRSPLHSYFQWDDSVAAHEYRLTQARHLIRSVQVIPADDDEPVRAFPNVEVRVVNSDDEYENAYVTLERAVSDVELSRQIVRKLYAQANAFAREARAFRRHSEAFQPMVDAFESMPPLAELEAAVASA